MKIEPQTLSKLNDTIANCMSAVSALSCACCQAVAYEKRHGRIEVLMTDAFLKTLGKWPE